MSVLQETSEEQMEKYEEKLNSTIKENLMLTVAKAQKEFKTDYLNFYKYFRAKYQNTFLNCDWNELFSNSLININVETEITDSKLLKISPK
jgi:hypothetical protein